MEPQGVSDDSQVLSVKLIERGKEEESERWWSTVLGSHAVESPRAFSVEINKQIKR